MKCNKVYGLKGYTEEEINLLKVKHPRGLHVTHKKCGQKLPHNGVFYSKPSNTLYRWADV